MSKVNDLYNKLKSITQSNAFRCTILLFTDKK